MKLAVDGRVLTHPTTGVARYLRGVLEQWPDLRRADDRLELLVDREPDSILPGDANALRILRWPLPGGDPLWRQVRLAGGLSGRAAELLFCPFYTIPLASSLPCVVTIHDVSFAAHPEWFRFKSRLAFRLAGPSAHKAKKVLTPSRFSAGEIQRHLNLPAERIEVTPLGLAPSWFDPVGADQRSRARSWLGWDGPYLLHLGAVHARRNVDLLVQAFARLAQTHPDLRLVIAGPDLSPGPDLAALTAELDCQDRAIRRPWVPEEHLRGLLAEASLLAYLSSYEGFGIPALEAMACGAPVMALSRASLPEVLGTAAAWVENPDPRVISDLLADLVNDEAARADLAVAGRQRAAEFTWRACAEQTFGVLRAVSAL